MARGALKGLKRTRPAPGEKVVVKGQQAQGNGGRSPGQGAVSSSQCGTTITPNGGADLDSGDLVSWLNCECFFSLVLVGLLAALPFNLHTQELMQTPETYVARAMEFSADGAFEKAASLFERAVNVEETAERHALLAKELIRAQRRSESLWHYMRAADLYNDDDRQYKVSALVSLGEVQTEEGHTEDAVETYLQVLGLQLESVDEDPPDPFEVANAHVQVATSMVDSHFHAKAIGHLESATGLVPDMIGAHELLAHTLRDMGSVDEAIRRYNDITAQRPTDVGTLVQLGFAHHELCDFSQALAIYKKVRSSPSKAEEMDYLIAALHSKSFKPPRAPVAYVSDLFDLEARRSAAEEADRKKTNTATTPSRDEPPALPDSMKTDADRGLFYDVHGLIFDHVAPNMRSMIEAALGLPTDGSVGEAGSSASGSRGGDRAWKWLDILDVGCGRGTMGTQLEPLANYMEGIDLSEKAILHASRTGHYDSIRQEDAISAMKTMSPASFDLVVAADLLPYFGDVSGLLRGISSVTRPGGLVAFNADALDLAEDGGEVGGGSTKAFELKFTGRWSHRRRYVTQNAAAAGLTVLGIRVVKGRTRLVSSAAGKIVLEATPQERRSTIFLCGKGAMTA